MAQVKQVRVLYNTLIVLALCAIVLWLLGDQIGAHRDAFAWGALVGLGWGAFRWRQLYRNIARRDRRYERNKIFVNYLNIFEVVIAAVAYNIYLTIPLGLCFIVVIVFATPSFYWWILLGSTCGLASTIFLAACIVCYECSSGPLYYQYKSEGWSGAEGLLYQEGIVVQPLQPLGKVKVEGVLWNAKSMSGETLWPDERIEVVAVERLTLYVDRVATNTAGAGPNLADSC